MSFLKVKEVGPFDEHNAIVCVVEIEEGLSPEVQRALHQRAQRFFDENRQDKNDYTCPRLFLCVVGNSVRFYQNSHTRAISAEYFYALLAALSVATEGESVEQDTVPLYQQLQGACSMAMAA